MQDLYHQPYIVGRATRMDAVMTKILQNTVTRLSTGDNGLSQGSHDRGGVVRSLMNSKKLAHMFKKECRKPCRKWSPRLLLTHEAHLPK